MGQKINERTEVFTSVNGYVTIWSYDPDTDTYSPGEKIKVENFLSTGQLDTNGILAWQNMLKMAIATDSLRNLAGANAYTQTANNGVYITSATTTNLPEGTNHVGTLEVYNSGTTKYLRYQTFNVGRIEIWTNYYNGTDWGTWDYANGDSSLAFEDGLTESGGVVRMGGSLTDNVEIDLAGFTKTLSGDDSQFIIDLLNTGSGLSTGLIVGSNIVLTVGNYAITIESTGIEFSHVPRYINMRALPSNDAALAVGTSVYYTDADTTNLPSTTKTGILECFDHAESGDLQLRYTTYTAGAIEMWGRKKTGGTWAAWAQLSGSGSGVSNFDQLTDTPAAKTGSAKKFLRVNADEDAIVYEELADMTGEFNAVTEKESIDLTDIVIAEDSQSAPTVWNKVKITFATIKAWLDTLYATITQVNSRQILHGTVTLPANPSFTGDVYTLPGSTPYEVQIGGVPFDISTDKSLDFGALAEFTGYTFAQKQGQWFIWMYISGGVTVLGASKTGWDILDETAIPIDTAYANDNGAGGIEWILADEKHAAKRNLLMHKQEHDTDGARWVSGLNTLTVGSGAANNSTNTFSLAGGVIRDEDKYHTISNPQTNCRIGYKNGSTNAMKFDSAGATYAKLNAGVPVYDNAGTLTDLGAAKFGIIWQYATNRYATPIVHILGQAEYASVAAAQAAPQPTLYGLSVAEWKLANRIIIKNQGGTLNWVQSDPLYQVTAGPAVGGGGAATLPAANVTFTPSGTISATNVQAAIEELDNDIQNIPTPITDILDLETTETDDTLVLAPDGAGGVEWRAESGGSTVIPYFDATIGTGGDYATIAEAFTAGKYKLLQVGVITETVDTTPGTNYAYIYGNYQYKITLQKKVAQSIGLVYFYNANVEINTTLNGATLNIGSIHFISSYIRLTGTYYCNSFTAINCKVNFNAPISGNPSNTLEGFVHCYCTLEKNVQLQSKFTNCQFFGAFTLTTPNSLISCSSTTLTSIIQPTQVTDCSFTAASLVLNAAAIIKGSKFTLLSLGSDNHCLMANVFSGAVTLNAGAENNIIIGNRFSGGFTNSSGNTTNIIQAYI
jgi:hypothetical protein